MCLKFPVIQGPAGKLELGCSTETTNVWAQRTFQSEISLGTLTLKKRRKDSIKSNLKLHMLVNTELITLLRFCKKQRFERFFTNLPGVGMNTPQMP